MGPALLAVLLIAYNNLANRWRPFNGVAYVPMNLVLTAVVLGIGWGAFGMDRDRMGLDRSGAQAGLLIGGAVAVVLASILASRRTRGWLVDRRLVGVSGWAAVYTVLVRIPLGTALPEEVMFRGVLLGAMLPAGMTTAIVASSIAFGLWHVVPTLHLARTNRPGARATPIVIGGVVLTTVAGFALGILRTETGGVAAPLLAHALVNSLAAWASFVARRLGTEREK